MEEKKNNVGDKKELEKNKLDYSFIGKPISFKRKKIKSSYFTDIREWYSYYRLYINNVYYRLLRISKNNNINIIDNIETYKDFVYTLFENSNGYKISKRFLDIV